MLAQNDAEACAKKATSGRDPGGARFRIHLPSQKLAPEPTGQDTHQRPPNVAHGGGFPACAISRHGLGKPDDFADAVAFNRVLIWRKAERDQTIVQVLEIGIAEIFRRGKPKPFRVRTNGGVAVVIVQQALARAGAKSVCAFQFCAVCRR